MISEPIEFCNEMECSGVSSLDKVSLDKILKNWEGILGPSHTLESHRVG